LHRAPYFSSALYNLRFVYQPEEMSMRVDKHWRLYFGDAAVAWSAEEQRTVLEHELAHLLQNHAQRRENLGAKPKLFNVAADLAINSQMQGSGYQFPGRAIFPKDFGLPDNWLVEQYYLALMGQAKPFSGTSVGAGKCGSGAGGEENPMDLPFDGNGDMANEGLTPARAQHIRQQTAQAIQDYASKRRGVVPGHWARWAESIIVPHVPLPQMIRSTLRRWASYRRGRVDYSYMRRSRRQIASDLILPGMVQPDVSVIVIVDTSGSISSQRLGLALGTIHAILRVLRIRVRVLSWDAAFQGIQEVSTVRDVVLKGGGGTDMAAALQYAQECRPRPDLVVVVTDGYTPWPKEAPRVPMIVFRFEEGRPAPDWAQEVILH
jgi:hypothetical protein